MSFDQIILEKLGFLFDTYGLKVKERRTSYLKLQTGNLEVTFSHNTLERSSTFWVRKMIEKTNTIEIYNKTLKLFFNSELKLNDVTIDVFVKNLVLFFENEGKPLLTGDLTVLDKLENFSLERNIIYTQRFLKK